MKNDVRWLVEPEIFEEDGLPLLNALETLKVPYDVCKFGTDYYEFLRKKVVLGDANDYVFYGSYQFVTNAKKTLPYVTVFCDDIKYKCSYYYPRFGEYLFNSDYVLLPFGDLNRVKHNIFKGPMLEYASSLFFKSDAFKNITGKLVKEEEFNTFLNGWKQRVEQEELVLISKSKTIAAEWRVVVVNRKVITAGQYKKDGETVRISEVPLEVLNYAQAVVDSVENPDKAWILDVCANEHDELFVLEIGPFSCCGLYACDCEALIKAINSSLKQDFNV